ncbi:MAG: hypothetical protein WC781_02540 [Candidatus Pacearchaeota archaeon]|jgi:DNA mismatch repair ATPase MutS
MKKELIEFTNKSKLSPFSQPEIIILPDEEDIFKTRDAKAVYKKVLTKISSKFIFDNTKELWNFFALTKSTAEIEKRQNYFQQINVNKDNLFLKELKKPKSWWKPRYDVLVVTENEKTFLELKELDCPVKFITSQQDVLNLEKYDLVQVIDCEEFGSLIETLPQSVFIDSSEDVYLERYLEILSSWEQNIKLIEKNQTNEQIQNIVTDLSKLLILLSNSTSEKITRPQIENSLDLINQQIQEKIKEMSISGSSLFAMLSRNKMPPELEVIITKAISESKLPFSIFTSTIPVTIDEQEIDNIIKRQNADEFTDLSKEIQNYSKELKKIPIQIENLSNQLIIFDFESGISQFISESHEFPNISNNLSIEKSENIFLEFAQPISFTLDNKNKCSILTGANSGGKTTLLEHIIQLIVLIQIGLPIKGNVQMPLFSQVYYFAKTKGSANKGAFETLLTQMSKIKPSINTLILADEIEAVTEPGVAGKIVSATADFFIKKGCFLIIATHLGQDIQKVLPENARVDGIEAKGLDENFELIVDHNPVLGRLAHSTPELIVEKMASSEKTKTDYFIFLNEFLKNNKD